MADAGVARDPGRLPWLEPYRAPPRRRSGRGAGVAAALALAGLGTASLFLFEGDPAGPDRTDRTGRARVVLPAPEEMQPQVILPPLESRAGAAAPTASGPAKLARPARRPAGPIRATPTTAAYREVVSHQAGEEHGPVQDGPQAAGIVAALPLAPPPPRPAVNPSAQLVRGKTVQLGVYLSAEQAEAAWQRAIRDYTFLVTMPKSIEPVSMRSRQFYRLQLGTPSKRHARQLCTNLKSIGRACTVA